MLTRSAAAAWLWPVLFLVLAMPTGLFLAWRVPLGHVPDERTHALRAEGLLHGSWLGQRGTAWGHAASGVQADWAIAAVITLTEAPLATQPEPVTRAMARQADAAVWGQYIGFVEAGAVAGYLPLFYTPAALAIGVVKAMGCRPAAAFLAARIVNLLCFGLGGAWALRVTRRGHALMACALLLPMTLSLAASCSQDGLLIACTALAAACVTRVAQRQPSHSGWFGSAWLLLALVIASKPPYAPLALILLIPVQRRALAWRACLAGLAVTPALVWLAVETRLVVTPVLRPAAEAGPLWPGKRPAVFTGPDLRAQLHVLTDAPWRAVVLPLRSVADGAGVLLHQMVGVLDYLCLWLPQGLYAVWFVALAASALGCVAGLAEPASRQDSLLVWCAVALCIITIGDGQYVQWTPVGMDWIGGIQGRYFLPLLPVLAIGLPSLELGRYTAGLAALPIAAALASMVWLQAAVRAFYPMVP